MITRTRFEKETKGNRKWHITLCYVDHSLTGAYNRFDVANDVISQFFDTFPMRFARALW